MSCVKKHAFLISLIILLYGAFFLFHQKNHTSSIQVLGASNNLSLFEEPDDGRKSILDAINNAQKEILVEMYILSDK